MSDGPAPWAAIAPEGKNAAQQHNVAGEEHVLADASEQEPTAAISRILVVRLGSMGDIVHTLPAVATLRYAFPAAHIGWVVEERWSELLCAAGNPRSGPRGPERPLVNAVHTVDTFAWRAAMFSDETWREVRSLRAALRELRYQVALDFQGAWKSAILARLADAESLFGSRRPREAPASLFYTRQIALGGRHIVEQNLSLAHCVARGTPPQLRFDLPRDAAAEAHCQRELRRLNVQELAILNPGAGWGAKRWPAERYAEVARALAQQGIASLVNHGPGEDALAREVAERSQGAAHPFPCSLGELIALTRRARLFVGGDTGPVHIAAALGIPVVAIYGPTDPARNGPFGNGPIAVLRSAASVTSHARRREPESGLLTIKVADVLAAAARVLSGAA